MCHHEYQLVVVHFAGDECGDGEMGRGGEGGENLNVLNYQCPIPDLFLIRCDNNM